MNAHPYTLGALTRRLSIVLPALSPERSAAIGRAFAAASAALEAPEPTVALSAVREEIRFPDECAACGASEDHLYDRTFDGHPLAPGKVRCATCGAVDYPSSSENEDRVAGWVDIRNPWGSLMDETTRELEDFPLGEAVDIVRDFPGAVWELREGDASQDFRTGAWISVTLFADAPADVLARLYRLAELSD